MLFLLFFFCCSYGVDVLVVLLFGNNSIKAMSLSVFDCLQTKPFCSFLLVGVFLRVDIFAINFGCVYCYFVIVVLPELVPRAVSLAFSDSQPAVQ